MMMFAGETQQWKVAPPSASALFWFSLKISCAKLIIFMSSDFPAHTPRSDNRNPPHPPRSTQSFTPGNSQNEENWFNSPYGGPSGTNTSSGNAHGSSQFQSSFNDGLQGFGSQASQQDQSVYIVTKLASREKLDDERRRLAHEFHMVCLALTAPLFHGYLMVQM